MGERSRMEKHAVPGEEVRRWNRRDLAEAAAAVRSFGAQTGPLGPVTLWRLPAYPSSSSSDDDGDAMFSASRAASSSARRRDRQRSSAAHKHTPRRGGLGEDSWSSDEEAYGGWVGGRLGSSTRLASLRWVRHARPAPGSYICGAPRTGLALLTPPTRPRLAGCRPVLRPTRPCGRFWAGSRPALTGLTLHGGRRARRRPGLGPRTRAAARRRAARRRARRSGRGAQSTRSRRTRLPRGSRLRGGTVG